MIFVAILIPGLIILISIVLGRFLRGTYISDNMKTYILTARGRISGEPVEWERYQLQEKEAHEDYEREIKKFLKELSSGHTLVISGSLSGDSASVYIRDEDNPEIHEIEISLTVSPTK